MPTRRTSIDPATRLAVQQLIRASPIEGPIGPVGPAGPATTDASLLTSGTLPLARLVGLTNAQLDAAAAIDWTKINKAGSSLADLLTRSAGDLSSGTLAKARMHADYPDRTVAESIAGLWDFANGVKVKGQQAGVWQTFAYAAGNFTASGAMTWTVAAGDQLAYRYMSIDKALWITFDIETTTVGGVVSTDLRLALPTGFLTGVIGIIGHYFYIDSGGAADVGYVRVGAAGQAYVQLRKRDSSNWTASVDATSAIGTICLEVQ